MKRRLVETAQDRFLVIVLVALGVLSVGIPIYEGITESNVPASWNTPLILLALYAIVKLVGSLPEIHTDVRFLRSRAEGIRAQRLPTVRDFYDSLRAGLNQASATIDLTHIRDTPPVDFGPGASDFFEKVLEWSEGDGRSVRRIIAVRSPAMLEWAKELESRTQTLPRFKVRVVDWTIDAPALNMAIIDDRAVFLALSGSLPERMKGLGIEDQATTQHFAEYYQCLWDASEDLTSWLANTSQEAFSGPR